MGDNNTPASGSGLAGLVDKTPAEHKNPFDPLYLHHSENSMSGAITPLLAKNNYHTWSRAFLMSLSIRNKTGFIDGTLTMPTTEGAKKNAWLRCNTVVMSWMIHSVSPDIKSALLYCKTATECWNKLKTRYAQPSDVRIYLLQQELNAVSQGNSSVTDFFTKLSSI